MVSEQALCFFNKHSQITRKVLSMPQVFFSYSSGNHGSDDTLKCPLVPNFPDFSRQLNVEEFLDWLIEVECFFERRNIAKRRHVKLFLVSSRDVHGLGGSKCKGCALG